MPVRYGWPLFLPGTPAPAPVRMAVRHAPRGGTRVHGKEYAGGRFLPLEADPAQGTLFSEADDTPPPRVDIGARTPPRDEPRRPLPTGPTLTSGLDSKRDSGYTPPETPPEEPAVSHPPEDKYAAYAREMQERREKYQAAKERVRGKEPWQMRREDYYAAVYHHGTKQKQAEGIEARGMERGEFEPPGPPAGRAYDWAWDKTGLNVLEAAAVRRGEREMEPWRHGWLYAGVAVGPGEKGVGNAGNMRLIGRVPYAKAHDPHRYFVEQALEQGKDIPPEVLADYPELTK